MTTATKTRRPSKAMAEPTMRELLSEALHVPGKLGQTYCLFYDYSFMNQLWLMIQGVEEPCGPYGFWKTKLDRQVRKGSKAKTVLHPVFVPKKDENGQLVKDKNGKNIQILVAFKPRATVFTYGDTDGPEIEWPELPHWDLDMALKALEVKKIRFRMADGNTQGYSKEREYAVSPVAAHPMKTTFHELAHIVLGHTTKDELAEYNTHRGIREFQAEATAYLLANELELVDWDASESRAYIQHWLDTEAPAVWNDEKGDSEYEQVTDAQVRRIFGAVNKILVAGRPSRKEEVAA